MLVDMPCTFLIMLSVFTFIRALQRGGEMIAVAALAIVVAFFSKYSTWLVLTILPVILVVYCIRPPSDSAKRYLLRGLLIFAAAGVLSAFLFAYKYDVVLQQMKLLIEFQKPGLRRWGESYLSTFFFQTSPLITLAALYSLYRAIRERDIRYLIVLWLPLLFFILRAERIRYTLPAFVMLRLAALLG